MLFHTSGHFEMDSVKMARSFVTYTKPYLCTSSYNKRLYLVIISSFQLLLSPEKVWEDGYNL